MMSLLPVLTLGAIYMGGHHSFEPFSPDSVLSVEAGKCALVPMVWTPGEETRLSAVMTSPLRSEDGVGFALTCEESGDTLSLMLHKQPHGDAIYQTERLCLRVVCAADTVTMSLPTPPEEYSLGSEAMFTLSVTPSEGGEAAIALSCGRFGEQPLWSGIWNLTPGGQGGIGFVAADGAKLTVSRASLTSYALEVGEELPSEERITALLREATEPYSGLWNVLDHNLDANYVRPGGEYLLAFLPTEDGGYDIVYVEGAIVNAGGWRTGMVKGHLTPTRMAGLYHARWLDAEQGELDGGAVMQFTGTDLCVLTLPSLGSTLRFHRVR